MTLRIIAATLATVVLVASVTVAFAQGLGAGRVEGAGALNVRQGPGASHPSIGMLRRGDTVTVHEIVGKWARVESDSLEGYVHSAFIEIDGSITPAQEPTPTAIPAGAGGEAAAVPVAAEQPATDAAPAPPAALDPELRQDIRRILALSEELQTDLEALRKVPPPPTPIAESSLGVQSGIGLLVLGGVVGFFIGTILGRQQERRGRSRVRI